MTAVEQKKEWFESKEGADPVQKSQTHSYYLQVPSRKQYVAVECMEPPLLVLPPSVQPPSLRTPLFRPPLSPSSRARPSTSVLFPSSRTKSPEQVRLRPQLVDFQSHGTFIPSIELLFLQRIIPKKGPIDVNVLGIPQYGEGWKVQWINGVHVDKFQQPNGTAVLQKLLANTSALELTTLAHFCSSEPFHVRIEMKAVITFPYANGGARFGFVSMKTECAHQSANGTFEFVDEQHIANKWCLTAKFRFVG